RDDRDEVAPPVPPAMPSFDPVFEPRQPRMDQPRMETRLETPAFEPLEEPRAPVSRRPANDDRETIGQILQAIQKGRPARNVYTLATLFAAVWIVGCGLLTLGFLPSLQSAIGQSGGVLILAGLAGVFF